MPRDERFDGWMRQAFTDAGLYPIHLASYYDNPDIWTGLGINLAEQVYAMGFFAVGLIATSPAAPFGSSWWLIPRGSGLANFSHAISSSEQRFAQVLGVNSPVPPKFSDWCASQGLLGLHGIKDDPWSRREHREALRDYRQGLRRLRRRWSATTFSPPGIIRSLADLRMNGAYSASLLAGRPDRLERSSLLDQEREIVATIAREVGASWPEAKVLERLAALPKRLTTPLPESQPDRDTGDDSRDRERERIRAERRALRDAPQPAPASPSPGTRLPRRRPTRRRRVEVASHNGTEWVVSLNMDGVPTPDRGVQVVDANTPAEMVDWTNWPLALPLGCFNGFAPVPCPTLWPDGLRTVYLPRILPIRDARAPYVPPSWAIAPRMAREPRGDAIPPNFFPFLLTDLPLLDASYLDYLRAWGCPQAFTELERRRQNGEAVRTVHYTFAEGTEDGWGQTIWLDADGSELHGDEHHDFVAIGASQHLSEPLLRAMDRRGELWATRELLRRRCSGGNEWLSFVETGDLWLPWAPSPLAVEHLTNCSPAIVRRTLRVGLRGLLLQAGTFEPWFSRYLYALPPTTVELHEAARQRYRHGDTRANLEHWRAMNEHRSILTDTSPATATVTVVNLGTTES